MSGKQIAALSVIILAGADCASADDWTEIQQYVYTVHAGACSQQRQSALLTGFRVKGQSGVVTALHGVVGCSAITANPETKRDSDILTNLKITKVDVKRDVALLESSDLKSRGQGGLNKSTQLTSELTGPMAMYGHRLGIRLQRTSLIARKPPIVPLEDRLPDDILTRMGFRNSPNTLTQILDLEGGNVLPGDSGAPILDQANRVVAIADGGLESGHDQISWAIPYADVQWRSVESKVRELTRLADLNARELFGFDPDPDDNSGNVTDPASNDISHREMAPLGTFGSSLTIDPSSWSVLQASETLVRLSQGQISATFILEDVQTPMDELRSRFMERIGDAISATIEEERIKLVQGKQFLVLRAHNGTNAYVAYFYSGAAGTLQAVAFGPKMTMPSSQASIRDLMEGIVLKPRFH